MLFKMNSEEKSEIKQVKSCTLADHGFIEKDLENIISKNIAKIIPENQLMVLFQEKPFDEAADIYAIDQKGDLYIFELKRWQSHQENILQVLRYGQKYGQYSYEQLNVLLKKYTKIDDVDLSTKHHEYFQESIEKPLEHSHFNKDQRFIVITNGVDLDTLSAIRYWKDKGLNIDSLVYKVYTIDEIPFIEFNTYNPENEVFIDQQEGYYIVNTNKTWMADAYIDMLANQKAAAYYDRKWSITNISKNDTVYLYHTGVGIIACGKAKDNYKSKEIDGDPDEEFYIPLKLEWKIDPILERSMAIAAWKINERMQSGYRFRQTVFSITEDMANVINELRKDKI